MADLHHANIHHAWMTGHTTIFITCDFPSHAADVTLAWISNQLHKGSNIFNTNRLASSISR